MINLRAYAKYFLHFQPITATKLASTKAKFRKASPGSLVEFNLGGDQSIFLRAGTHDIDIFEQIFLLKDCHIDAYNDPSFIIDAGAHVGCSSVYFAQCFPNANILAIEAESGNYKMLHANTKDHPRIKSIHGAVWYKDQQVQISNPDSDPWGFQVGSSTLVDNSNLVDGYDINSIIKLSGREKVDIIKLDVEGAELNIFSKGNLSWMRKIKLIMIELHDRVQPGCTEAFSSAIKTNGFKILEKTAHNVIAERND